MDVNAIHCTRCRNDALTKPGRGRWSVTGRTIDPRPLCARERSSASIRNHLVATGRYRSDRANPHFLDRTGDSWPYGDGQQRVAFRYRASRSNESCPRLCPPVCLLNRVGQVTIIESEANLWVLKLQVVRSALDALRAQRIHEHFPAYLHLRQRAISKRSLTSIEPTWNEVAKLLRVPGGPPTKPHYRPFSSHKVRDPSVYWLNPNLAGSYAPKSIRNTSRFMLDASGDGFALAQDHAQQALTILLFGVRVPAWAIAAYYLRDCGFSVDGEISPDDLVQAFRQVLHFDADAVVSGPSASKSVDGDFEILFQNDSRPTVPGGWFERWPASAKKEHSDA